MCSPMIFAIKFKNTFYKEHLLAASSAVPFHKGQSPENSENFDSFSLWTQKVNGEHIRLSKDVQDVSYTFNLRSVSKGFALHTKRS